MAYRRSITARAKHLYEQLRFSPSISHLHCSDDRKNSGSSSENHRILSYIQRGYGAQLTQIPFRDRNKFSPPQLMVPLSFGRLAVRNMSNSAVEGIEDIGRVYDVAGVLTEKAVEAVASQTPMVNEVAIAAADSSLAVSAFQYLVGYIHCISGFNWWASIICTTLLVNFSTLPLLIHLLKGKGLQLLLLKLKTTQDNENTGMAPAAVNEHRLEKQITLGCVNLLLGLYIKALISINYFLAIRNMAENVPSFKEGGAFWFTDLSTPDSTLIFPVLIALTIWIRSEPSFMANERLEGDSKKIALWFDAWLFTVIVPFTACFPKAILCYWLTSNLFSLLYVRIIRRPEVQMLLGVVPMVIEVSTTASQQIPQDNAEKEEAQSSPAEESTTSSQQIPQEKAEKEEDQSEASTTAGQQIPSSSEKKAKGKSDPGSQG